MKNPVVTIGSLAVIAIAVAIFLMPTLAAVAAFQVARRAGNFALTQPARQVLYTVVSREDRYKAKNFIDTAVYRAGDQVGAWSYALIGMIGWGIKEAGIVSLVVSAVWLVNSLWLGRRQEALAAAQEKSAVSPAGRQIAGA